jgi:Uma2 family endonuclease
MLDPQLLAPERVRPLLRREYERLVELGVFEDERIELLRGQLVVMSPQGEWHSTITARIHEMLLRSLDESFDVRSHSPFAAAEDSEPEPDVSVSRKLKRRKYHPRRALLLVEVAEISLRKDRDIKASIYAENGAPEYWIVDVEAKCVHVYSRPRAGIYTQVVQVKKSGFLRPTELPGVKLSVTKLFGGT